jgi:HlyD family secretion protein
LAHDFVSTQPTGAPTGAPAQRPPHVLRPGVRLLLVLAVIGAGIAAAYVWSTVGPAPPQYVTEPVTRGDIVKAIVTTGSVNPVVTVQVGTYVSGVIKAIYCDFNTHVKAGQLCAKIDPRPYQLIVDQDVANLASSKAQLEKDRAGLAYAKANYDRDRTLLAGSLVSQNTVDSDKSLYDQAKAQIAVDEAAIRQHEAALNAARVNLDYTDIVSPVDGVVISRNVDVGQTVAASFQTPTLFLIAKDLTKMQVDTNVSESDIGAARIGQKAFFTVEAYPDKTFSGRVTQVRQAPITVQNVVTYDVVVGVDNSQLELLPGMTANVRIITAERQDALRVPLQALRFAPGGAGRNQPSHPAGPSAGASGRVWVLHDGKPEPVAVTTGLSDNTYTEVTGGGLQPGERVIVNQVAPGAAPETPRRSPLRF